MYWFFSTRRDEKQRHGPNWLETQKTATTDKITGPQLHIQTHKKLKRKKKSYCGEKSVHGSLENLSFCPVSQDSHAIFSFTDVFNQPSPIFFSPQGVSFESFSSISSTRLYSNAITQGIKGTSIICIAYLFPFKALKDCNLKQKIIWYYRLFICEGIYSGYL